MDMDQAIKELAVYNEQQPLRPQFVQGMFGPYAAQRGDHRE